MKKWALFLSGRGSTAQAILDLLGDLDIRLVVSSKKSAYGALRARRSGVPVFFAARGVGEEEIHQQLCDRGVERIFLCGYMKILSPEFVEKWKGKIFNVHPSLLPSYPGANAMQKSFSEKGPMGVTIHEVIAEMDAGPKILQASILYSEDWELTRLRMARLEQRLIRELVQRQEGCSR